MNGEWGWRLDELESSWRLDTLPVRANGTLVNGAGIGAWMSRRGLGLDLILALSYS